jgi:trehalose 6-phosphate phosphatase
MTNVIASSERPKINAILSVFMVAAVSSTLVTSASYEHIDMDGHSLDSNALDHWLPNAVEAWESISTKISGKKLSVFLDCKFQCLKSDRSIKTLFIDDGTLTPIVKIPSEAIIDDDMRNVLQKLSEVSEVSIVTGRLMATIRNFLRMDNLYYATSHGCEIQAGSFTAEAAPQLVPFLKSAFEELKVLDKDYYGPEHIEGCIVENNKYSVSVHYRNVPNENDLATIKKAVERAVNARADNIKLTKGSMVSEFNIDLHF